MSEQEAIAYIEEWDVTEAAKVLKWYEEDELLRPCDCDTIVAIETENLHVDNDKLRELVRHLYECMCNIDMDGNHECDSCEYDNTDGLCDYERLMRELGVEVE